MAKDDVDVRLRLLNAKRFQKDSQDSGKSVEGIGKSAVKAKKLAESPFRALSKGLAGIAAGFAGFSLAKGAISATETLAKTTLTLNRSFGLSVELSSQWAAVAQARGADGKQLTMGFKALATQSRNAALGSKQQVKSFELLGVSQADLIAHGDDLQWLLGAVADGLERLPAGTNKAAIMARLFGRTWTSIAPLLRDGSAAMNEQLQMASDLGATMGVKTVAELEAHIKAERKAKLATLGLQIAFGEKLAPTLTKALEIMTRVRVAMHEHEDIIMPLIALMAGLAAGIKIVTVATAVWNSTLWANPIGLVVIAIVALGAALFVAYRKVGWFRRGVQDVWSFIKGHWPLLLGILTGPIGPAVVYIVRHWDQVKQGVHDVWGAIRGTWNKVINFLTGLPGRVKGALRHLWDGIPKPHISLPHIGGLHFPGAAAGGTVRMGGGVLVGERGPELLRLPAGARVDPLEPGSVGDVVGRLVAEAPANLVVDGRTLATATVRFTSDYKARRGNK
jgi:hypothetical protein